MEKRRCSVTFYYEVIAVRSTDMEVELDTTVEDPVEQMGDEELDRIFEACVGAQPLMTPVCDEETEGAYSVAVEDLDSGQSYSRELFDRPWASPTIAPATSPKEEALEDPIGIGRILSQLSADPIFAMSLGSKELFHSNFIAWLIETHRRMVMPRLLNVLGITVPPNNEGRVLREWHNFDIAVEIGPDDLLIIENKFKSMPRLDQLDTYARNAKVAGKGRHVHLVLLSPSEPLTLRQGASMSSEDVHWHRISYSQLLSIIKDVSYGENDCFSIVTPPL
jgi:hypothetical protein